MTADAAMSLLVPSGLATVSVDTDLVIYDPHREQAHLLNPSAAEVWRAAAAPGAPGASVDDVIDAVAQAFALDRRAIRTDVRRAVDDLLAAGLLVTDANPETATSDLHGGEDDAPERSSTSAALTHTPRDQSLRARALDVEVTIASEVAEVVHVVDTILAPLVAESERAPGPASVRIDYVIERAGGSDADQLRVRCDGNEVTSSPRAADAVSTLLWHYNHEAIERTTRLLLLHSSAVATDDGALALPAVADSGKSTLATALVRAGYRYLTDEALALDPENLSIEPYPKPIGLDPGSFPLFPDLEPTEDELPPELFHHKWWLDPRRISPLVLDAIAPPGLPLRAVVFPTFVADAEPSLESVEHAEGVILLARNAFNLKRWGQRGLDMLATVATTVPLYRMTHNDLATSLDLLAGVIGAPPPLRDNGDH